MFSVRLNDAEFIAVINLLKLSACADYCVLREKFRSLILELNDKLSRDDEGELTLQAQPQPQLESVTTNCNQLEQKTEDRPASDAVELFKVTEHLRRTC